CEVSQIPAFGHLAKLSRKKYGKRISKHKEGLKNLFEKITPCIEKKALVESDMHKFYPGFVRHYLPKSTHQTYQDGSGCVVVQGELKKLYWDPLFALNHTCAMRS